MKVNSYKDVRVLIAEPRKGLRDSLTAALSEMGFVDIIATGNLKDVRDDFERQEIDLLIGETVLPEGSLNELIRDIRMQNLGTNPFVVVMSMIAKPNGDAINAAVNAGADDILLKPIAVEMVKSRVQALIDRRKKFVVTTDYVGPDRRSSPRKNARSAPAIDVPNTLQIKTKTQMSAFLRERTIKRVIDQVNEMKIEAHAHQIKWLSDRIAEFIEGTPPERGTFQDYMVKLEAVSLDVSKRLKGTRYAPAAEMCLSLSRMLREIRESDEEISREQLTLLGKLSGLIARNCSPDRDDVIIDDNRLIEGAAVEKTPQGY